MLRTLAALALSTQLGAQVPMTDALHAQGRDVTIRLLTMGTSDELEAMFGHSAIWIHNNATGRDTVFNWGVFDWHQPHFIQHFLEGLNMYQMGGESFDEMLPRYRLANRTVWSQELDLSAPQKDSLLRMIRVNAQPENVTYRYDYFRNNCSTRPRDMLDAVLGGQLHAKAMGVGTSYRWHALRLMQGDKPLVVGVDIGLGEPSDRPITKWDEMFLPREVHDFLATFQVMDSAGATHPLVRSSQVLYQATRPDEPKAPPKLTPWLSSIGLVMGGVFAWLGVLAVSGNRAAQIGASVLFAVWSLTAGLLGVVLTLLWTVTDHVFAYANENLLLFNPLWLVLFVMLPLTMGAGRAVKATRIVTVTLAAAAVVALVVHIVRLSPQSNLAIIGLALPPAIAIAWSVARRQPR